MANQTRLAVMAALIWTILLLLLYVVYLDPLSSVLDDKDTDPRLNSGIKKVGKPVKLTDCTVRALYPLFDLELPFFHIIYNISI